MYCCLWEPLGGLGRCWIRIPWWSNPQVDWTDVEAFGEPGSTWKHRREGWECQQHASEHLGVPVTSLRAPTTSMGALRKSLRALTSSLGALINSMGAGTMSFGAPTRCLAALTASLVAPTTCLVAPMPSLAEPMTSLAVPTPSLWAPCITVEQAGNHNIIAGNAAGAPGIHSYYVSCSNFENSCTQFVFSSMYLCIYVPILQPIYTGNISTGCRQCLRAIRGAHQDNRWVGSEMCLEAVIEQVWTCTWRPWWCQLGGHSERV